MRGERLAVEPQHVLDEGRAGLRGADVHEHPPRAGRRCTRVGHGRVPSGAGCAVQLGLRQRDVHEQVEHVTGTRRDAPGPRLRGRPRPGRRAQGSHQPSSSLGEVPGPALRPAAVGRRGPSAAGPVSRTSRAGRPACAARPTAPRAVRARSSTALTRRTRSTPAGGRSAGRQTSATSPRARGRMPSAWRTRDTVATGSGPATTTCTRPAPTRSAHCRASCRQVRRRRQLATARPALHEPAPPHRRAATAPAPTTPAPSSTSNGSTSSTTRGVRPPSACPAAARARRTTDVVTGGTGEHERRARANRRRRSGPGERRAVPGPGRRAAARSATPAPTRTSSSTGTSAGSTGVRRSGVGARAARPGQRLLGQAAPGGGPAEHQVGQRGAAGRVGRRPGRASRRTSSSWAAPGTVQPSGAGEPSPAPRATHADHGVLPPERQVLGPGPGGLLVGVGHAAPLRAHRGRSRRAARPSRADELLVGVGSVARPPGRAPPSRRGRRRPSPGAAAGRGSPSAGPPAAGRGAGPRGRRPRRCPSPAPTRSTPRRPRSAQGKARGRQGHLGHVRPLGQGLVDDQLADQPAVLLRGQPGAACSRRLSLRSRKVSAAPIETFSRSLCSGAQAGSMPNASAVAAPEQVPRGAGLRAR